MRRHQTLLLALALLTCVHSFAQRNTAFTYQGRLVAGNAVANGYHDLRFTLFASAGGNDVVGGPIAKPPMMVSNGLFSTTLDFGAVAFDGENRWLEIAVRASGSEEQFTILAPRLRITATPYALQAMSVSDGSVTAQKLSAAGGSDGQVLKLQNGALAWGTGTGGGGVSSVGSGFGLVGGPITSSGTLAVDTTLIPRLGAANSFSGTNVFTHPSNRFVGAFIGNGGGLSNLSVSGGVIYNGASITNLNAANIASGTLADARLSANVALLTGAQSFSGAKTFNNAGNGFVGTFNGNGAGLSNVIAAANYNGANVTNLNAANIATGTLGDARLSANVALLAGAQSFSGAKSFNNAGNSFVGTFSGNGAGLSNVVAAANYNGASITNLNAANIATGTLGDARLSANVALLTGAQSFSGAKTFNNAGNSFIGTFNGNGAGLSNVVGSANYNGATITNLNAANVATGTLGDARLSANVALLTGAQSFSGAKTFNNAGNSFVGTFNGNGAGLSNVVAVANYNGASITNLNAANIATGTLGDARLSANVALLTGAQTYSGAKTFNNSGNSFVGVFSGNGAGLSNVVAAPNYDGAIITNLNAANIATGTLADARLSANVALLNGSQSFSGAKSFNNSANSFVGTFNGNGAGLSNVVAAPNYDGAIITNLNAANIATGTLGDTRLSANVALLNGAQSFSGAKTFNNSGNSFVGTFSGNGAGLSNVVTAVNYNGANITNLNAANVATGTLGDARLSANVALLAGVQSFSGAKAFNNAGNSFVGTFSGNGAGLSNVVAAANYNGANITNLNAANIAAGTLADPRLSSNVPLLNRSQSFSGANLFANGGNSFVGAFIGNGSAVTNLNAANITGVLPDAQLSANVALLNRAQNFTASNSFSGVTSLTNANNRLVGKFSGDGAGLSNVVATIGNLSGDITGSPSATVVNSIRGVGVSVTLPTPNQVLRFNGSSWSPATVALGTDVSGTLALANGGTAASTASGARANLGAAASGANTDITSLNNLTTPLSAAQGGSGQSSYTVGDVLYANAATSLAKLSDIAPGSALISGGVGAAPQWGKIGLATHVNGTLAVTNGGTGGTNAASARTAMGAAASGANSDITSLAGLTTPLTPAQGGSGQSSYSTGDMLVASGATTMSRLSDVATGNVLLSGGVSALPVWGKVALGAHTSGTLPLANGGTGATNVLGARASLGAAASGANSDILSLSGLTTPLSPAQGGSGQASYAAGDILYSPSANTLARRAIGSAGQVLTVTSGAPAWANANLHNHYGQVWSGSAIDALYLENNSGDDGASAFTCVSTGTTNVNYGIFGQTSSENGTAVQGSALATAGFTYGVVGEAQSPDGTGVYGYVGASSGTNAGVIGETTSPWGSGVFGQATSLTGTPVGVFGYCQATNGYGLYTPNRLYVGNNAFVAGSLGIGSGSRLNADVGSSNAPSITFLGDNSVGIYRPATNVLGFVTSGNERMRIATNGNVGIGRVPSVNRLEVEGEASKSVAGNWLANSDARIKTAVRDLPEALEKILQVRPVAFHYSAEYLAAHPDIADKEYYNVIAQEFAKVFPGAVKSSGEVLDGKPILQVDTYPATICSIAAIRELDQLVKAKDRELAELKQRNAEMESRLAAIEKVVFGKVEARATHP